MPQNKLPYWFVKRMVEKWGYELLTTESEFVNTKHHLRIRCKCGNEFFAFYHNLEYQRGKCLKCVCRTPYAIVWFNHANEGYDLESTEDDYVNSRTVLNSRCPKKHLCSISVKNFNNGHRCRQCYIENMSVKFTGEGNPNYNYNLTEDERSEFKTKRFGDNRYSDWWLSCVERDGKKCRRCGCDKNLQSHHIFNWRQWPNLRFEINNGITLCDKCHLLFHQIYRQTNNNQEQLDEYLIKWNFLLGSKMDLIE